MKKHAFLGRIISAYFPKKKKKKKKKDHSDII